VIFSLFGSSKIPDKVYLSSQFPRVIALRFRFVYHISSSADNERTARTVLKLYCSIVSLLASLNML